MMNPVLDVPLKCTHDKNRHRVEKLILNDCHVTVNELEATTENGLARYQIRQLIHDRGLFRKL